MPAAFVFFWFSGRVVEVDFENIAVAFDSPARFSDQNDVFKIAFFAENAAAFDGSSFFTNEKKFAALVADSRDLAFFRPERDARNLLEFGGQTDRFFRLRKVERQRVLGGVFLKNEQKTEEGRPHFFN